jgi:hypothetical protein
MLRLVLIALGLTNHAEHKGRAGELRLTGTVASLTEMTVTERNGIYLAEARCLHTPGCDGEPILAWSSGPAVFAFDGNRIEVDGSLNESLLAGGPK